MRSTEMMFPVRLIRVDFEDTRNAVSVASGSMGMTSSMFTVGTGTSAVISAIDDL